MPRLLSMCVYILLIHVLYKYVCTCMYLSMYTIAIVALVHQTAGMPAARALSLICSVSAVSASSASAVCALTHLCVCHTYVNTNGRTHVHLQGHENICRCV